MRSKILWVEGKRAESPHFTFGLQKKGFTVLTSRTGIEALASLVGFNPDLLVINAASMHSSGKRISKSVRTASPNLPILLILDEDQHDIKDPQVDVILVLPFTLRKILNRIRLLLPGNNNDVLHKGPIQLDLERNLVRCQDREVSLTPRLAQILKVLLENPGIVLDRKDLFRRNLEDRVYPRYANIGRAYQLASQGNRTRSSQSAFLKNHQGSWLQVGYLNFSSSMIRERVFLLGVGVNTQEPQLILTKISETVKNEEKLLIAHANLRGLNLAYKYAWLRDFYNGADWVYCDGMGVKLGASLLGYSGMERFTLADWVWPLSEICAQQGLKLYLLGGEPGVAQKAAEKLLHIHPDLNIAGFRHGYFDQHKNSPENSTVLEQINMLKPDILLVGFGMPQQERWLNDNWNQLNVRVAITCGALFEYLSEDLKRGPRWMTDHYLEWLARIWISPRRYLNSLSL